MISPDTPNYRRKDAPLPRDSVRTIWIYVIDRIVRQGDSWDEVGKTDKFD